MNARARKARRILRDHRRGTYGDYGHPRLEARFKRPDGRLLAEVYANWKCPHCRTFA